MIYIVKMNILVLGLKAGFALIGQSLCNWGGQQTSSLVFYCTCKCFAQFGSFSTYVGLTYLLILHMFTVCSIYTTYKC